MTMVPTAQRPGQTATMATPYRNTTNQCIRFFYTIFYNYKEHEKYGKITG